MRNDLPVTGGPGRAVLAIVRKAVEHQWDDALRAAEVAPGTVDDKVAAVSGKYVRELTLLGAAAGGTAAMPGIGTVTALGAVAAEVGAFAYRASELIMAMGAAHGRTDADVEERMSWVLAVLTHGADAAAELGQISATLGAGMTIEAARNASTGWFQTVNGYLGRKLIARFGARRGASIIGKVLPFGIGAAFGAGTNYAVSRRLARHADRFFVELGGGVLPPPMPALMPAIRV